MSEDISISKGGLIAPMHLEHAVTETRTEVFALSVVEDWNRKAIAADQLSVGAEDSLAIANRLAVELAMAIKAVDARKDELCGPAKKFQDSVRGIVQRIEQPLMAAKKAIANKITIYVRDRDAKIAKERQEAQAKLDAVARIERERLEAEIAEAHKKQEQDARDLADLMGDSAPVVVPPPAPVITAKPAKLPDAAPVVRSTITVRKVKRLKIIDASLIPYQIGSETLMEPQRGAITRCLTAGASVPGCILEEVEETATRTTSVPNDVDLFA